MSSASVKQIFHYKDTINNYVHLRQNWDSYNADPISKTAIDAALEVLNQLNKDDIFSKEMTIDVFPMRNGGIQFEFEADDLCVELEINTAGQMLFIVYDEEANLVKKNKIYELSEVPMLLEDARYAG